MFAFGGLTIDPENIGHSVCIPVLIKLVCREYLHDLILIPVLENNAIFQELNLIASIKCVALGLSSLIPVDHQID